ncbi:MAG TPA: TolC family protein [Gemmataceae bacterium]|nr:TolC family protein [Gemmataceae bacterium]
MTQPAAIARASGDDEVPQLPSPRPVTQPAVPGISAEATGSPPMPREVPAKTLPINLDTVLRLAEGQSSQIALARSRVEEAFAAKDVADKAWLPSFNIGPSYTRHEGGITNPDGTLTRSSFSTLFGGLDIYSRLDLRDAVFQKINAERQVLQQKGELRRVTSETLLEAASTYVDLLAARSGEAIALSLQKDLQGLLERARVRAEGERGARVEVAGVQAQLFAREQTVLELRSNQAQASAKLAYLLGLDPSSVLVPVDDQLVALDLVDASQPASDLVAQAVANGPGIREMESLLALIHQGIERAKGPTKYLPIFEMRMLEGGYGSGPGDSQVWDNRWDFGIQARWNLTEWLTARERERGIQAKTNQAHLAYQDLRNKLALGVQESRETILSSREQIRLAQLAIAEARHAQRLSDERFKNHVEGSSLGEVLLSFQAVAAAQVNYLSTLRSYDKAQLQLMVVLGQAGNSAPADGNCPNGGSKAQ